MKSLKSWDALALGALTLWPFVYFFPVTIGEKVFYADDIFRLFLPLRTELARALAEGRLPLWTPNLEAGFPLFAEGEVAALYPINLIFTFLFPAQISLGYTILFHLAWLSVGMFILNRSSGFDTASAFLAGFVFGFSGFVIAHVHHSPHLAAGSWLPWLILFQQKYWRARSEGKKLGRWFVLACFAIGLQFLAGFPQMALLNTGTFALFGIFSPILWRQSARATERQRQFALTRFANPTAITFLQIILGMGLSSIQLLPTVELLGLSTRAHELGQSFFTSHSLEPLALTQFVLPFWRLGQPSKDNIEYWAYLGVLPFFLACAAAFLRRDARTWFLGGLALLSLALALGDSNPIHQWLYYIPVFNRFRVPARFLFLFAFAAALLAATALQELRSRLRDSNKTERVHKAFVVTFVLVLVSIIWFAYNLPFEFWQVPLMWSPWLFIVSGLGTVLIARHRVITATIFTMAVLGLTFFDLTVFSIPFLESVNRMAISVDVVRPPRTVQVMDNAQPVYRVFGNNFKSAFLSLGAIRTALSPNIALQYGKQGVMIYAPLPLEKNEEYVNTMSLAMRNLMNIRYYLLPLEIASPGESAQFDESEPNGGLTLDVLNQQPSIPPTSVTRLDVTSYADQTDDLENGFLVGEIVLRSDTGKPVALPVRLGMETADWAFDALARLGKMKYSKPSDTLSFPAFLSSVGRDFEGHKYVAHYAIGSDSAPLTVTSIGVRSFLPGAGLTIERISLVDETGHSVSLASLLDRNDLTLAFRSHTAAMWENLDVLPRAFLVHASQIVPDDQVIARLQDPAFDPRRVVFLAEGESLVESGRSDERDDRVEIVKYEPERVTIRVETTRASYLVLADTWYPGWVAMVDGQTATIARADYIFRAIKLDAGEHQVVFEYRPASFWWGAAISGIAVLFAIGIAVRSAKS